jgi:hypothetical protein
MPSINTIQVQQYLEKIAPFYEGGYVTIHHLKDNGPGKKPSLPGNAHTSIKTALSDITYWVTRGVDVYMCLSASTKTGGGGNPYPIAHRKKGEELGTKCLWVDIDVKDGAYSNTENAGIALAKVLSGAKLLPPSMIVGSGTGGFHVYWTCKRMIRPKEFAALSDALIKIMQKFKLIFDAQCTRDHVRVLRPSGTFNFKHGKIRSVKTMFTGKDYSFEELQGMLKITIDSDEEDKLEGAKFTYEISDIDQVATACPHYKKALETGGAGYSEPLWTTDLQGASFCSEPEETAKRLSKGHKAYLEEETVDKIKYITKDHAANPKIGPPKCDTFYKNGAEECKTCPHRALKRSPLNVPGASLPNNATFQGIQSDDLPPGYYRGDDNHIYTEVNKKMNGLWEKQTVDVFPYPIVYKSAWAEPNCADYHHHFITHEEGTKEKHIMLPFSLSSGDDSLKRTLAMQGLPLPNYAPETRKFMQSYQEMLRSRQGGMVRDEPIGWTMTNGEFAGFSYDGQYFSSNVNHTVPRLKGALLANYSPMGSPEPWIALSEVITEQCRPALNIILLSGFAAPLVPMTGHSGIILGCYSPETGIGKSTSMEASTAIWGHPVNSRCGLNDTVNMAINKAGQIKHLPLHWDEIKTKQQFTNLSNIVFQMTEGREKGRLNRNAEAKDMKDFQTLMTYASNASVIDSILETTKGTAAGFVRDFEFRVPTYQLTSKHSTVEVQNMLNKLKTNYGMIGLAYAKYLGENGKAIHKDVVDLQTVIENRFKVGQDERFWASAMTVLLAAAKIANAQKWVNINIMDLFSFLEREFNRMRNRKAKSPLDYTQERGILWLLSRFISENRASNLVIVNKIPLVGRPKIGEIEMEGRGTSKENFLREINVVIGREGKMIRFTDSAFGKFCRANDIPPGAAREGLSNILGGTKTNGRLTAGLGMPMGPEPVWLIKLEGTPYEKLFEL